MMYADYINEEEFKKTQDEHGFANAASFVEPDTENLWGDDVLERKGYADILTRLVKHQTEPFVLCIDGAWGSGKSFLLRRWQQQLENDKFETIYFNSWEDDFCDDPFLALIGQILESKSLEENHSEIVKNVRNAAGELINQIVAKSTGIDIKKISYSCKKDGMIESSLAQRKEKITLKNFLQELGDKIHKKTGKPLIFIIDELDRCRPDFAIELLERVKHIFDAPNMVFVFGINKSQLEKSVKSFYGEIDAEMYFRRFFDFVLKIPEPDAKAFLNHLLEKFELPKLHEKLSKKICYADRDAYEPHSRFFNKEFHAFLCLNWHLSLRDMEHYVRSIVYIGKIMKPSEDIFPRIVSVLILLKLANPELYDGYMNYSKNSRDMMNFLHKSHAYVKRIKDQAIILEYELYALDSGNGVDIFKRVNEILSLGKHSGIMSDFAHSNSDEFMKIIKHAKPHRLGDACEIKRDDLRIWVDMIR